MRPTAAPVATAAAVARHEVLIHKNAARHSLGRCGEWRGEERRRDGRKRKVVSKNPVGGSRHSESRDCMQTRQVMVNIAADMGAYTGRDTTAPAQSKRGYSSGDTKKALSQGRDKRGSASPPSLTLPPQLSQHMSIPDSKI